MLKNSLLIFAAASLITLSACSTEPKRSVGTSGTDARQLADMNNRLTQMMAMLEAAQNEAAAARIAAEQAQATAEIAQEMSALTDEKIEQMFQRSVFK